MSSVHDSGVILHAKGRPSGHPVNRIVGVAFKGRDRDSLTVLLDAVPLSGKVVLMPPRERDSEQTSRREPGVEG